MILKDKTYNIFKWVLIAFVPALITLITTLGTIYNFDSEIIVGTIGAIATFIGGLIGISNYNYSNYDGETPEEE